MFSVDFTTQKKLQDAAKNLEDFSALASSLGSQFDSTAKALSMRSIETKDGKFRILVIGRFKNGKSTLTNAILGAETMAAKATACTAVIAVVNEGTNEKEVIVRYTDGTQKRMSLAEFTKEYQLTEQEQDEIDKAYENGSDIQFDRFSHIMQADMQSRNPMFRNGVSLTDTPGLEEALSRDKTTRDHLPNAHAIVFTMSALALFGQAEKKFINENFVGKRNENVFVVVNRVNQLNPGQLETQIMPAVRHGMQNVFVDAAGNFDEELYNRRVFYVNAYDALNARIGKKGKILVGRQEMEYDIDIDATGVPEFEDELNRFLNSNERIQATLSSALAPMYNTYAAAADLVSAQKAAGSMSASEFAKKVAKAESELNAAEKTVEKIKQELNRFSKSASDKLYMNLMDYFDRNIKGEFPAYVSANVDGKNFSAFRQASNAFWNMFGMLPVNALKKKAEESMQKTYQPFYEDVQNYIEHKINSWKLTTDTILKDDVADFKKEMEELAGEFDMHIEAAVSSTTVEGMKGKKTAKTYLQVAWAVFGGKDLSVASDIFANGGEISWGKLITESVTQGVIDSILLAIDPAAVFLKFGIDLLIMAFRAKKQAQSIELSVGESLIAKYKEEISNKEFIFKQGIADSVMKQGEQVLDPARKIVAEKRASLAKIKEHSKQSASQQQAELARLQGIMNRMHQCIDKMYLDVYETKLSEADFCQLVNAKTN